MQGSQHLVCFIWLLEKRNSKYKEHVLEKLSSSTCSLDLCVWFSKPAFIGIDVLLLICCCRNATQKEPQFQTQNCSFNSANRSSWSEIVFEALTFVDLLRLYIISFLFQPFSCMWRWKGWNEEYQYDAGLLMHDNEQFKQLISSLKNVLICLFSDCQ